MNRKFVKENKKVLKEFIFSMLAGLLSKRAISNMDRLIDASPELKKEKDAIVRMSISLRKKISKTKNDNPSLYNKMKKDPLLKKYL